MASKKERFWFIDTHTDGEKLAIVEKGTNVVTQDGWTSQYKSVTEVKGLKIRGVFTDDDLVVGTLTGSYSNIPSRFHQYIVDKVISLGYRDPRSLELQSSQFFDSEYEKGVKKAKQFARSNYVTVGHIVPKDF